MRGTMRWRYNIVRNCEMFWFGVTANILRDPSSFIAIDSNTWMVSDEGFCLEHCRRAPPFNFLAFSPGPPAPLPVATFVPLWQRGLRGVLRAC